MKEFTLSNKQLEIYSSFISHHVSSLGYPHSSIFIPDLELLEISLLDY